MSWRVVIISNRCKLDYKMGYMVVRGEETKRVFINEIAILLIESIEVSLTCCLLEALINNKIKVIFCDGKKSPLAELVPYYGAHDCSNKIKIQINWTENIKGIIWKSIVSQKIKNQSLLLYEIGKIKEANMLMEYMDNVEDFDETNREGHAAKVYFNALFGKGFSRDDDNIINASLNYGYSILLSTFNREVVSNGYLTQIGIHHKNMFNYYNLSCDLMEPFRPIIDKLIYQKNFTNFDSDEKKQILSLLNSTVCINSSIQTVLNAIKIYVKSVFDALNNKDEKMIFYYEL